jgi:hypothetical protein
MRLHGDDRPPGVRPGRGGCDRHPHRLRAGRRRPGRKAGPDRLRGGAVAFLAFPVRGGGCSDVDPVLPHPPRPEPTTSIQPYRTAGAKHPAPGVPLHPPSRPKTRRQQPDPRNPGAAGWLAAFAAGLPGGHRYRRARGQPHASRRPIRPAAPRARLARLPAGTRNPRMTGGRKTGAPHVACPPRSFGCAGRTLGLWPAQMRSGTVESYANDGVIAQPVGAPGRHAGGRSPGVPPGSR